MFKELRIPSDGPMILYCDNKATINGAHNPVHHDRTKHIEIDRHFLNEKIEKGTIYMIYIPSSLQLADVLTKGLSRNGFEDLEDKLGMVNIYSTA